jgi:hypothetical protein
MAKRRSMKRKSMKTMKKRRMSKMRHSKKMIRKSRKMRGGGLWNWLTGKKSGQPPQAIFDQSQTSQNGSFTGTVRQPTVVSEEYVEVDSNTSNTM